MFGGGLARDPAAGGGLQFVALGRRLQAVRLLIDEIVEGVRRLGKLLRALLLRYFGAKVLGYNFKMVGIPDSVNIGKDPLAFDPKQMRAAFDAGREIGTKRDSWLTVPPNTGDIPSWAFEQIK